MSKRTTALSRAGRVLVPAVGAGVLAAVLAGCAAFGVPGAAAVVDGRTVSENDVQVATGELRDFLGDGEVTTQAVVYLAVIAEPVADLAAERGLSISADQAEDVWLASRESLDGESVTDLAPATTEVLATVEMFNLLLQDDQAAAQLSERIAELDLEVNPRYGVVDETTVERQIVLTVPDWQRPGG